MHGERTPSRGHCSGCSQTCLPLGCQSQRGEERLLPLGASLLGGRANQVSAPVCNKHGLCCEQRCAGMCY